MREPILLALLSVLSSTAYTVLAAPNAIPPQSIPMSRRSRGRLGDQDLAQWAQNHKAYIEGKYGFRKPDHAKRASGQNLITNLQFDSSYFGSIAVGTPPKPFNVILDTGSADLWLATSTTGSTSSGGGVTGSNSISLYNPGSSSSFSDLNTPFQIQYGSGAAEGTLGKDTVQFSGFQVTGQTFALVTRTTAQLLNAPLSGLMGLAFEDIASSQATPFWQTLVNTPGTLDSPLMAFQLTRYTNDSNADNLEPGGTFTLGAVNNSLFTGDIDYQNIPSGSPGYWILQLSGMAVQGKSITLPSGSGAWAAIDTGTTGIGMPSDIIASIFAQVPGAQKATGQFDGYWTYPCSTNVNVEVQFGSSNNKWTISPPDFTFQELQDGSCLGSFFELPASPGTTTPPIIMGDTFLKNVYSVFRANPASVGFAALSSTAINQNGADLPAPSPTILSSLTGVNPSSTGVSVGRASSNTNDAASSFMRTDALFASVVSIFVMGLAPVFLL